MEDFKLIIGLLFAVMLLDAVGDAFRFRKWQVAHHIMEVVVIGIWMLIAGLGWIEILMYVLARIAFFDPVFNVVSGLPLKYAGNSSLYDRFLRRFTLWIKEPGFLIWVIRALALYWWVTWFFTNAGNRFVSYG